MRLAELLAEKGYQPAIDFIDNAADHDAELRLRIDRLKAGLSDHIRRLGKLDRTSKQYANLASLVAQREVQIRELNNRIYNKNEQ